MSGKVKNTRYPGKTEFRIVRRTPPMHLEDLLMHRGDLEESVSKKSSGTASIGKPKHEGPLTVDELFRAIHYATEKIEKSIPEGATAENGENYLLEYAGRIIEAYTESDLKDLPELKPCITKVVQPFLLIPSAECCSVGVNNMFFMDGSDLPKNPHADNNSKTNIVNLLDDK